MNIACINNFFIDYNEAYKNNAPIMPCGGGKVTLSTDLASYPTSADLLADTFSQDACRFGVVNTNDGKASQLVVKSGFNVSNI